MKLQMFAATAAALALAGCSGMDGMGMGGMSGAQSGARFTPDGRLVPTPAAPVFLMMAGAGDLYEIQSSQALLETTQNAELRRFAQMMIDHHTETTAAATAAARAAGLTPPPPMLDAPKAAMIAALRGYQGVERDRLYLAQQGMAHKEALALNSTYARDGDTPQLRDAAAGAVPYVERHMAEIMRMTAAMR